MCYNYRHRVRVAFKDRKEVIDMEKAFKFRIYPNKTQQVLLQKTFGCTRYIYNHFLAKRIELYKQNKSGMSYNQCSKELTVLKQELTWLKEPDKDALQKSLKAGFSMRQFRKSLMANIMFPSVVLMSPWQP